MTKQLGILLTQTAIDRYGDNIRQACPDHVAPAFIAHDPRRLPDHDALEAIDIAYVTTELAGGLGEADPDARLRLFARDLLAAPRLQWLHVCSAGTDRPMYQQLARRGVIITSSSGANALSVAHTAMAGMLALVRNIPLWVNAQRQRQWRTQRHAEACDDIDGGKAVIVGLGPIGREIARLCKAFGLHVVGVRRQPLPLPECDEVITFQRLADVLADAAWLILACPLTPETRNLVDASILARLPASARLINVGRGGVVDENALNQALHQGKLAGAYCDVFEREPLPLDSPLWDAPNFLLSAHSAGASKSFGERATAIFIDNLERWLSQQPMRNVALFEGS